MWIEQGKQIGRSLSIERDGRRFWLNVAIQKREGVYRVLIDEIDEGLMAAEEFEREDEKRFDEIDAAVAFIEGTTPIRMTELAPSKGQRWFR